MKIIFPKKVLWTNFQIGSSSNELKMAGSSHRTAQPPTLAAFRPWEGSAGAGRVRPAGAKIRKGHRNTFNVHIEVVLLAVNRRQK